MDKFEKELSIWIITMFFCTILIVEHSEKRKQRDRADYLQKRVDSLIGEQLPVDVRVSRYEHTLEILDKKNKKVADEFRKVMSENTE